MSLHSTLYEPFARQQVWETVLLRPNLPLLVQEPILQLFSSPHALVVVLTVTTVCWQPVSGCPKVKNGCSEKINPALYPIILQLNVYCSCLFSMIYLPPDFKAFSVFPTSIKPPELTKLV